MAAAGFVGFEWDTGNRQKCQKHGISIADVEHVLSRGATLIVPDAKNSLNEPRFVGIGRTRSGRLAFVVFTPRDRGGSTVLRPISARYMHRKEIAKYEQEIARLEKR
jgi:uncharacterized DUF497 family protein